ncbi:MAG: hypothetical protein H6R14_794 [Proteobacteria bacterium]|nr:hypothetical protein [Pseudomonadota bacterium]
MTTAEALDKARDIARGSTCFLMPVGGVFKICRRVDRRVITLGKRTDASQALSLLRRVCNH